MANYNINIVENMNISSNSNPYYPCAFWQTRSLTQINAAINKPDNYWAGDSGTVTCPQGYGAQPYGQDGYGIGVTYTYILTIIGSTDQYLLLGIAITNYAPQDSVIQIYKDNIKENSFQYSMIPISERANRVRVKYSVREEMYVDDVVEVDDEYDIDTYKGVRSHIYDLDGIKRQTQAQRMAAYLGDYNSFVNWKCSFETDILGYLFNLGDIIGITEDGPGWNGKLFRLNSIEATQDYETSMGCVEYISDIYHDYATTARDYTIPNFPSNKFAIPSAVRNFQVMEDHYSPVLYFAFSIPEIPTNYFVGALIYKQKNSVGTWESLGPTYCSTSSCNLLQNINSITGVIQFDPTTVIGSFPESGKLWIGNEIVYYYGIDEEGQFLNCERGCEESLAQSWSAGNSCILYQDTLFNYQYNDSDVGQNYTYKAIAITSYGVSSNGQTSPETQISIYGYALSTPYPVGDIKCIEY